jgi:hypothetical protein
MALSLPAGVTVKDVQDHIGELFSKFNMRILVNGNMDKSVRFQFLKTLRISANTMCFQEAISIAKTAEETLTSCLKPGVEDTETTRQPHDVAYLPQDEIFSRGLILPECTPS